MVAVTFIIFLLNHNKKEHRLESVDLESVDSTPTTVIIVCAESSASQVEQLPDSRPGYIGVTYCANRRGGRDQKCT